MKLVKLFIILGLLNLLYAQNNFEFNGYWKALASLNKIDVLPKTYSGLSSQLRLNFRYYPMSSLTLNSEIKTTLLQGDFYQLQRLFNPNQGSTNELLSLNETLYSSDLTFIESRIDRLWAQYANGNLLVTAGRQRIAWGTALAWNPTDLFNPVSPLDFDNEEKNGADAIRGQYYLGPTSKIDLVYKAAKDKNQRVISALLGLNYFDYDLNLIIASYKQNLLLGFSWAGDIKGAGFRGELVYHNADDIFSFDVFGTTSITNGEFISGVISFDYTFESSLYLQSEILYNGNRLGLSGSRWSLLFGSAYQFTSLSIGNLTVIYNPIDYSKALLPSVSYSLITNLDVSVFALLTYGNVFDEFPGSDSYYLRLKWSF